MTQQSLGDRIAQARREMAVRERRDVSQLDAAKAIGVTGAAVSQWESDERVPREEALAKLAAFLGVTPAYLRYGVTETVMEKPGDIRAARPISGMGSVPHGVPITPDVPQQKKGKGGGR